MDSHSMSKAIIRSAMAIVSIISSSTLIWMIFHSRKRLTPIYHRILLGMSIADILYSLGLALFNATSPRDNDYFEWNARGNQATCDAQGFIVMLGAFSSLMYSCSLNVYYLVVVKYQKSDRYIRKKIEPFFHGIPIVYGLVGSITLLVKQNLNDNGGGSCFQPVYNPPHCQGYEDGQIPEGFGIPCGRGRDGAVIFYQMLMLVTFLIVPIVIGASLGIIYRAVLNQEKNIARYGAAPFNASAPQADEIDAPGNRGNPSSLIGNIRSFLNGIQRCACRPSAAPNQQHSKSRIVLYRALAYSIAYFLSWSFLFIGACLEAAGAGWPLFLGYLTDIFNPLQGFFNFCIFMYPKLTQAKSKGGDNMTWCQAFAEVIGLNGFVHSGKEPNASRTELPSGNGTSSIQA